MLGNLIKLNSGLASIFSSNSRPADLSIKAADKPNEAPQTSVYFCPQDQKNRPNQSHAQNPEPLALSLISGSDQVDGEFNLPPTAPSGDTTESRSSINSEDGRCRLSVTNNITGSTTQSFRALKLAIKEYCHKLYNAGTPVTVTKASNYFEEVIASLKDNAVKEFLLTICMIIDQQTIPTLSKTSKTVLSKDGKISCKNSKLRISIARLFGVELVLAKVIDLTDEEAVNNYLKNVYHQNTSLSQLASEYITKCWKLRHKKSIPESETSLVNIDQRKRSITLSSGPLIISHIIIGTLVFKRHGLNEVLRREITPFLGDPEDIEIYRNRHGRCYGFTRWWLELVAQGNKQQDRLKACAVKVDRKNEAEELVKKNDTLIQYQGIIEFSSMFQTFTLLTCTTQTLPDCLSDVFLSIDINKGLYCRIIHTNHCTAFAVIPIYPNSQELGGWKFLYVDPNTSGKYLELEIIVPNNTENPQEKIINILIELIRNVIRKSPPPHNTVPIIQLELHSIDYLSLIKGINQKVSRGGIWFNTLADLSKMTEVKYERGKRMIESMHDKVQAHKPLIALADMPNPETKMAKEEWLKILNNSDHFKQHFSQSSFDLLGKYVTFYEMLGSLNDYDR